MSVDLDELDRLRAAATQGEWEVSTDDDGDIVIWCNGEWLMNIGDWSLQDGPPEQVKFVQDCDRATADYIVALVRAYPALAAELRELRAKVECQRDLVECALAYIQANQRETPDEEEIGDCYTHLYFAAIDMATKQAEPIVRTRGPKP